MAWLPTIWLISATPPLITKIPRPAARAIRGRLDAQPSTTANKAQLDPYKGLYSSSKAALDAISRVYAAETATTSKVKVMSVNPGKLRTRMRAQSER